MQKMLTATTDKRSPCSQSFPRSQRLRLRSYLTMYWIVLFLSLPTSLQIFAQSLQIQPSNQSQPAAPTAIAISQNFLSLPIGSGDLIDVQVFGTPELSGHLRVDEDGYVNLPAGGRIHLSSLTAYQASNAIESLLRKNQIMMNPEVTIFVVEYATQGITVLGEVKSPGTYSLLGSHNLYDVLAAAGGSTQSQGATITITHKGDPDHPQIVAVHSPNYSSEQESTAIRPGDTVVVSRASIVYIMGDVSRSGAFYLQNGGPITVLNGLAMAQGLSRTASTKHAEIIRKDGADTKLIPLNLSEILKHKQTDILLEAGDILYIPTSEWKRFVQTFGPASAQAVANAAAIAAIAN